MLSLKAVAILQDIQQVLEVPHTAQEPSSSEHIPTLLMALPAYEELAAKWQELQGMIWELSHYIGVGLERLEQYHDKGHKTHIYALSMSMWISYFSFYSTNHETQCLVINPYSKLEWIKRHWSDSDACQAQEWMIEAV